MKSFSQLMARPTGILCRLLQHCQTIKQLNKIFRISLSAPLSQHCYVANLRDKTLVIHTDTSLWATRLRYMIPELLCKWQQDMSMPTIDQVEVRVRPALESKHCPQAVNTVIDK
ncbi:DUF721 domain-containing protein [Candidatus Marithioploca araucensis]|uniref:DUF721 domain-containing protein n=1 Tax=Candidatus Marithioploca araucensis TaxID=70273 RepID=A0ABT7VQZ0_9GAMM|nr:DUF721 domain-containing protein [Thiotrichales bacterium HSG14]MDM8561933.1 DUF721 domain-containing protein [Candidatus Marithioploca araucensis]